MHSRTHTNAIADSMAEHAPAHTQIHAKSNEHTDTHLHAHATHSHKHALSIHASPWHCDVWHLYRGTSTDSIGKNVQGFLQQFSSFKI